MVALASRASACAARGPSPTGASATSRPGPAPSRTAGEQRAARRAEDDKRDGQAAAIAGRSTSGAPQRRRRRPRAGTATRSGGGSARLPLLAPERLHPGGDVAQLRGDVVALGHAPSTSIISRRRVSPRTMRALTVPMGMPVAALISLWLSSS